MRLFNVPALMKLLSQIPSEVVTLPVITYLCADCGPIGMRDLACPSEAAQREHGPHYVHRDCGGHVRHG